MDTIQGLEAERLSPATLERAVRAVADRRLIPGPQVTEFELVRLCGACGPDGWYRERWPNGAVDTGRCRHLYALASLIVERERFKAQDVVAAS